MSEVKLRGTKFEVGKSYRCTTGLEVECVYAYEGYMYHCMFGKIIKGENTYGYRDGEYNKFSGEAWTEIKEPRTIKGWVNIYQTMDGELSFGNVWESKEKALEYQSHLHTVDTIPIEYVEKI